MHNQDSKPLLLTILSSLGEIEIVNDSLLTFKKGDEEPIMLRYSIGETFSFLKGADPSKIQLRDGFEPNMEKVTAKLDEVISKEIEAGFPVKSEYESNLLLEEIRETIEEYRSQPFDTASIHEASIKGGKIMVEYDLYSIIISSDKSVCFKLKSSITKIEDIGVLISTVDTVSDKILTFNDIISGSWK